MAPIIRTGSHSNISMTTAGTSQSSGTSQSERTRALVTSIADVHRNQISTFYQRSQNMGGARFRRTEDEQIPPEPLSRIIRNNPTVGANVVKTERLSYGGEAKTSSRNVTSHLQYLAPHFPPPPVEPSTSASTPDADDNEDFDKFAEEYFSQKKSVAGLREKLKKLTDDSNSEIQALINVHKETLKGVRRRHAEEINKLEDSHEMALTEKRQINQGKINEISNKIHEIAILRDQSQRMMQRSMKRKFPEEEEEEATPECPVCMTEMIPPKKIYQCSEGHLVCSDCLPQLQNKPCATCRNKNGYISRSRFAEDQIIKKIMKNKKKRLYTS